MRILSIILIALMTTTVYANDRQEKANFNKDSTFKETLLPWNIATSEEFTNIQNRTLTCSGTYPIGNILEQRTETLRTLINGEVVTTYSPWTEITRDCRTNIQENKNVACPANQHGTHSQKRNYVQYYDGRIVNDTGWSTVSNTCNYYLVSNGSETRKVGCPAGQTGAHNQRRTFQNWSDGSKRNYSGWATTSNTCKAAIETRANGAMFGVTSEFGMQYIVLVVQWDGVHIGQGSIMRCPTPNPPQCLDIFRSQFNAGMLPKLNKGGYTYETIGPAIKQTSMVVSATVRRKPN